MSSRPRYVRFLEELTMCDVPLVGGKNAFPGEMYRDSEIIAFNFDGRDEGVKTMIRMAVEGTRRNGRHSGLCGQASSGYADMAEFLAMNMTFTRALAALMLCFGSASVVCAQAEFEATTYRLIRGSTLTRTPLTPGASPDWSVPIAGTMSLRRLLSPLDWETFRIEAAVFRASGDTVSPPLVTGNGYYRRGGRGPIVRSLTLEAEADGERVDFDSGSQPDSDGWPRIDIEVKGATDGAQWLLHVIAVPLLQSWHYSLIDGSTLLDDCAVCDRPPLLLKLSGGFDLVLTEENPLFSRYRLFDIDLQAPFVDGTFYRITGEGDYQVGGEVVIVQKLQLDADVEASADGESRVTTFTDTTASPQRRWPMLQLDATDDSGTILSTIILNINAAPFRDIWFSTASGMTPAVPGPQAAKQISGSDLLSLDGHVIRPAAELLAAFDFVDAGQSLGVDALDAAPRGTLAFSLGRTAFSSALGVTIQEGDALSEDGRILQTNQQLTSAFGPMPIVPDAGLDALHVLDSGEALFSIRSPLFSEKLGITLGRGDVLSSRGVIHRTHAELLSAFQPVDRDSDFGLDALYVWPQGEIWFSVEYTFVDSQLGVVNAGDLLSDQGFIVQRNLDLVHGFSPLEDLADFGLDGLFVINDTTPRPSLADQHLLAPVLLKESGDVSLQWNGTGRAWQLSYSPDLRTPFVPLSPILPVNAWLHREILNGAGAPSGFYRLQAW
jgi:hypothetical protein